MEGDIASYDGRCRPPRDQAKALEQKIEPRWYDRQAFKAYNFVKLCERFVKRFKELDPQAITGFEGTGDLVDGTDIDLLCRIIGFGRSCQLRWTKLSALSPTATSSAATGWATTRTPS